MAAFHLISLNTVFPLRPARKLYSVMVTRRPKVGLLHGDILIAKDVAPSDLSSMQVIILLQ